jgi:4-hydroxy-tetrahydrodipicolinate reductase
MGSTTCTAVAADPDLRLVAVIDTGFDSEAGDSVEHTGGPRAYTQLQDALRAETIDVVVDFTVPASVHANVLTCLSHSVPAVVGTTGLSDADLAEIASRAAETGTPVLVAPNFAMGAVLMMEFARQAAKYFSACEIVELHHDSKLDAPSGTSRLTRARIEQVWREAEVEKEVAIHSVRLPGFVAHQEVIFGSRGETLTIRHDSLTRESFMPGVILAVKRIRARQGLIVGLENVL